MRSSLLLAAAAALPALSGSISAQLQQMVFPTQANGVEGETSVNSHRGGVPWWAVEDTGPGSQYYKMQLISDVPSTFNDNIQQLFYRRDGVARQGLAIQAFATEIEVVMSTSPNTSATMSTTFANNVGNDATIVLPRRRIAIGAQQWTGNFPEALNMRLFFTTPFPYDASQGSLCMEVKGYSNDLLHPLRLTPVGRDVDAMTSSTQGAFLRSGERCPPPNPWEPPTELHAVNEVDGNGMLNFHAWRQFGQHHSQGYLFGSLGRVPFGTGFAVNTLSPNGCGTIDIDVNQVFMAVASGSNDYGEIRWPKDTSQYIWSVPYNPAWIGSQFYIQELWYDVHTQEYSTSNWVLSQTPTYLGANTQTGLRVLWSEGPNSHTDTTGTLGPHGLGPVQRFN